MACKVHSTDRLHWLILSALHVTSLSVRTAQVGQPRAACIRSRPSLCCLNRQERRESVVHICPAARSATHPWTIQQDGARATRAQEGALFSIGAQYGMLTGIQYLDKRLFVQLNGSRKVIGVLRGYDVRASSPPVLNGVHPATDPRFAIGVPQHRARRRRRREGQWRKGQARHGGMSWYRCLETRLTLG